jgi:acyl carrier protein
MGNESFHKYTGLLRQHLPLGGHAGLAPLDRLDALGLDSLNAVALLLDLEEAFDVSFPDDALSDEVFRTVGSLWSVLSEVLATQSAESYREPHR